MIIQALLNWFSDILTALANLLSPPIEGLGAMTQGLTDGLMIVANAIGIVDPIIPATAVAASIAISVSAFMVLSVVWAIRVVVSLFTGGGGDV